MLRARLEEGPAVGTFLKLPRPEVVEVLALAGLDFAILDLEHGQIGEAEALAAILAGRASGLPITVRIATPDRGLGNRLLEAGAAGLQLARASAATAEAMRDWMRYPPDGSRSISTAQPSASYGAEGLVGYMERVNRESLVIGQIETADHADGLDRTVAALDVAFIGPLDLSVDLGHPGELDAPPVTAAFERIEAAARDAGTVLGVYAGSAEAAERAIERGYRYIALSSDLAMLSGSARSLIAPLRRDG